MADAQIPEMPGMLEMPKTPQDLMDKFLQTFYGRDWPKGETYLVCTFDGELLKTRNGTKHAEIFFLDKMNEAEKQGILQDSNQKVQIKCYINWTPCGECAKKLVAWKKEWKATVARKSSVLTFITLIVPASLHQ